MLTAERPAMRRVLVVNEDESARQALQVRLRGEGYEAVGVASIEGIRRALGAEPGPAAMIVILPAGADQRRRPGGDRRRRARLRGRGSRPGRRPTGTA